MGNKLTVAVLGASAKPQRYSYKCVELLKEHGHKVIPVTPAKVEILGIMPVSSMEEIKEEVDILTMYVNAERSTALTNTIISLNPRKIIFNPGAENPELRKTCEANGIKTESACTLVLLNTNQFGI